MKHEQWFVKRLFWPLFIPSLLSALGLAIGAVADSFYIGRTMSDMGLFIIGAASPIYMVYTALSVGIAAGGAIHFAAAMSKGGAEEGRKIFRSVIIFDQLVICTLTVIGLIFARPLVVLLGGAPGSETYAEMLGYVRLMLITTPILFMQAPLEYFVHTDNNPKLASLAMVAGTVVDCLSGYLFIVVLDVGICGSIYATVCGALVMEFVSLCHFIFRKGTLRLEKLGEISGRTAWQAFVTGFATAAQYIYQFVILLCFNRVLLALDGESAVAAYDIVVNAASLVTAVFDAIVLAIIPLVSTFFGERNREGLKESLKISLTTGVAVTAVGAGLLVLFAAQYCSFAGLSEGYLPFGVLAMRWYMASMVLAGINSIVSAYFQNIGCEKLSYVIMGMRGLIVLLPCGILCAGGGYDAFWSCYIITESLVFLFIVGYLLWRKKGKSVLEFNDRDVFSETFVGSCATIASTCERIQDFLSERGVSMKKAYFITLGVEETCQLIGESNGELMIQLTLVCEKEDFVLHVRDNAYAVNPFELDEEDDRMLSLMIVKDQAKDFYYRQYVGFNTLTIVF